MHGIKRRAIEAWTCGMSRHRDSLLGPSQEAGQVGWHAVKITKREEGLT